FRYVPANVPFYPPGKQWGVVGEPIKQMQLPLPPEESRRHYVHPAAFELRLFASEPVRGRKPIAINWDDRGRLRAAAAGHDPHDGPSNLRYGPDNWLYGIVGYAGFEGTVGGVRHSFRQGFYRFRPDGTRLEFLRNTNNNSWGVGFSEEGVLFGSTANANPSE